MTIEFDGSTDRWDFEQKHGCGNGAEAHDWKPVSVEFERTLAGPGRCYVVCLSCGACTYIETYWPGYKLSGAISRAGGQG